MGYYYLAGTVSILVLNTVIIIMFIISDVVKLYSKNVKTEKP